MLYNGNIFVLDTNDIGSNPIILIIINKIYKIKYIAQLVERESFKLQVLGSNPNVVKTRSLTG
jgi:hypothetical protein